MSPRMRLVRDLLLLAGFFGGLVVLVLALGLAVTGNFTWIWLARAMLVSALLLVVLELAVIRQAVRVNHIRGPLGSYRLTDRTQGCTIALLGACLAFGLLFCSAVFDWLLEWQ